MYLVADIGNTRAKYAVFQKRGEMQVFYVDFSDVEATLKKIINQHSVDCGLISSVVNLNESLLGELLNNRIQLFEYQEVPIINLYKTPHTLGRDRLANAVGAWAEFPSQNSLVIDAGTCIKFDFINKHNEYLGGSISPGIQMRFNALNTFTDKLPLLQFENQTEMQDLTGNSTESSMLSGVLHGVIFEVEGMIEAYKKRFNTLNIIITGGNAEFLVKHLKSNIFARPNLAIKGLAEILKYNEAHSGKN
jgi:type III pantothenate kinase